ncbi:MAG: tRNA (adenine(22)-N(1))-methyltransferase TrmK [Pseudoalteromonas distincta]
MKLSKRLQQIDTMVTPGYAHIWDCCCDHGLLGAALLARAAAPQIHFVDIVPKLIDRLNERLQRFYPDAANRWQTHCLDVSALPLDHCSGRHLVIIAGVGGDQMTRFVEAIHLQQPNAEVDFLLCPVHQEYALRQCLIALDWRLEHEALVKENKRFYEVLRVSKANGTTTANGPVSPTGCHLWHARSAAEEKIARDYLSKTLQHYENIQRGQREDVQQAIAAYRAVQITRQG